MSIRQSLHDSAKPHVVVTLVEREGSVPCDVGSFMVVTETGRVWGTVGGGRVEARAIEHARALLSQQHPGELLQWNLNTDLGMTCGGRLRLFFDVPKIANWPIVVFGAGHVSQALVRLLRTLPCQLTVIDSRSDWIERLPPDVVSLNEAVSDELIQRLDDRSQVVSLTKGHASDLEVLSSIARSRKEFVYVGVIGSKSKAVVLRRGLQEQGFDENQVPFECPVGLPIGSNHPGEIAVSIAARLLEVRDRQTRR
ncbi:MAG: xanthine dehydrogenase accessory protein XdhC [Planctomycetota bacterium]